MASKRRRFDWQNIVESVFGRPTVGPDSDYDVGEELAFERTMKFVYTRNANGFPEDEPSRTLELLAAQTMYFQQRAIVNRFVLVDVVAAVDDCLEWLRRDYKTVEARNNFVKGQTLQLYEAGRNPAVVKDASFFLSKAEMERQAAGMRAASTMNTDVFWEEGVPGLYGGSRSRRVYLTPQDWQGRDADFDEDSEYGGYLRRFLMYSRTSETLLGACLTAGLVIGAGWSIPLAGAAGAVGAMGTFWAMRETNDVPQPPNLQQEFGLLVVKSAFTYGMSQYFEKVKVAWYLYMAMCTRLRDAGNPGPYNRNDIRGEMYTARQWSNTVATRSGLMDEDTTTRWIREHSDPEGPGREKYQLLEFIIERCNDYKKLGVYAAGLVAAWILFVDSTVIFPRERVANFFSLNTLNDHQAWATNLKARIARLKGQGIFPGTGGTNRDQKRRCDYLIGWVDNLIKERPSIDRYVLFEKVEAYNEFIQDMREGEYRYRKLCDRSGHGVERPRVRPVRRWRPFPFGGGPRGPRGGDDDDDDDDAGGDPRPPAVNPRVPRTDGRLDDDGVDPTPDEYDPEEDTYDPTVQDDDDFYGLNIDPAEDRPNDPNNPPAAAGGGGGGPGAPIVVDASAGGSVVDQVFAALSLN